MSVSLERNMFLATPDPVKSIIPGRGNSKVTYYPVIAILVEVDKHLNKTSNSPAEKKYPTHMAG